MITLTRRAASIDAAGARRHAYEGARAVTPMVVGIVPFGLAIGATIGTSSMSTAQGIASAPLILAGAAQLSVVQMLDAGAAPAIIVLSAIMINARLLLYSASLAPWFRNEPLGRRLLLAIPVIDQLHFTCVPRFEQCDLDGPARRWYYTGAAVWLAGAWTGVQMIAIAAGASLPAWTGLHLAAPLALAALLAKGTQSGSAKVAAAIAAAVAVFGHGLPFHSAVLVATIVGIGGATLAAVRPIANETRNETRTVTS